GDTGIVRKHEALPINQFSWLSARKTRLHGDSHVFRRKIHDPVHPFKINRTPLMNWNGLSLQTCPHTKSCNRNTIFARHFQYVFHILPGFRETDNFRCYRFIWRLIMTMTEQFCFVFILLISANFILKPLYYIRTTSIFYEKFLKE